MLSLNFSAYSHVKAPIIILCCTCKLKFCIGRFKLFETTFFQLSDLVEHWDRTTLSRITAPAEGLAELIDDASHMHPPSGRGPRTKRPGNSEHYFF